MPSRRTCILLAAATHLALNLRGAGGPSNNSPSVAAAHDEGPDVVLTSFVQYDTESQNLGANTRLRWTFKPGKDLFVVWNRGWRHLLYTPDLALRPDSEFVAVKLRWTFRE